MSSQVRIIQAPDTPDVKVTLDGEIPHVIVDSMPAGGSGLTDTELRASAVPVSLASVPSHAVTDGGGSLTVDGSVSVSNFPATQPVSGTFWQATQPVSLASAIPVTDNSGSLTVDASVGTPVAVRLSDGTSFYNASQGDPTVTFKGRINTFATPGRAGTTGQKIFALFNAVGSTKVVRVKRVYYDVMQTAAKVVEPAKVRVHRITAIPTNGTSLTKVAMDSSLSSNASITVWGDASADKTGSATTLTITIAANTMLCQEWAARALTLVGYEQFDRPTIFEDGDIICRASEGICVFLDYTVATANPTTDIWLVGCEWTEE